MTRKYKLDVHKLLKGTLIIGVIYFIYTLIIDYVMDGAISTLGTDLTTSLWFMLLYFLISLFIDKAWLKTILLVIVAPLLGVITSTGTGFNVNILLLILNAVIIYGLSEMECRIEDRL